MGITAIRNFLSTMKLRLQGGYNAKKYWRDRHTRYGFNMRGVGNKSLSIKKNERQYRQASEIFLSLCNENEVDFKNSIVLDVGCGNGFYTQIFKESGCSDYTGIDITNVLLPELKKRFSNYQFCECDIARQKLTKRYDLIIMIDVTQHITSESKFRFALNNIKDHMRENGLFIVTSFLNKKLKNSYYEKSRDLTAYTRIFSTHVWSEPKRFRDKYILAFRATQTRS
jgi:2-polyprenyl-3-methyl-5-hydroxy-6-metoxy-1,4-benzoquinol methylase